MLHDPTLARPLLAVVLLLVAAVGALVLALLRERSRGSRASSARQQRAQAGEREAQTLLAAEGYRLVEIQARRHWPVSVDRETFHVELRADLLVERDGCLYLAEVKTGRAAPDPLLPATRRQLLEYLLAFQPDGLLLVDAEAGEIIEVAFPGLEE